MNLEFLMSGRLLTLAACALAFGGCSKKNARPAAPPPPEVSVITVAAESVPLTTELPGRISAVREAQVRARATGILQKRLFEEGANVKEGQVLFQIDPLPLQAALNSAKAEVARTEAVLAEARARVERYKGLVEIKAVSQQVFDEAVAALGQYEAGLLAGKAAIETAQLNLGYAEVVAPISGRIGRALVTEGALVSATEATQLAVIRQLDPVYVDITQSSTDLMRLRRGIAAGTIGGGSKETPVKVLLEDGSFYSEEGKLLFTDVSVDPTTGMVTLRAVVPNPNNVLLPGMFARAVIAQGVVSNVVTVPQRTLSRATAGAASVMVVNPEDKVEVRGIRIEREVGTKVLVEKGLKAGERVIVEGLQKARPGEVVKPVAFQQDKGETNKPAQVNP